MRMLPQLLPLVLASLACHTTTSEEIASHPPASAGPRTVAILLYEGVELLDFAGPGEVFSAARGPAGRAFRVVTVANSTAPVRSQGFVNVTPQHSLADCPAPDIVVVPGGNVPAEDAELQEWVRRCAQSAELVMSVCNGALLLAEAGLLDGLEATTHHGSLEALAAGFPEVRVHTNRRFVDSGRVMTCAGVSAGIDGALHVVERLLGGDSARATARYMEYEWRPEEIAKLHAEPGRGVYEGAAYRLASTAARAGTEAALREYRALAQRPAENELDQAGYALLRRGKKEEARALLELAAAAFPGSPSTRDSLAEACEALGDAPAALKHSEAALAALEPLPAGMTAERAALIRNASASRLVRLGRGDASSLRFGCPPCGGPCDAPRFVAGGPCPGCHMEMVATKGADGAR